MAKHRIGGTCANAHIATDAEGFIQHYHTLMSNRKCLGRTCHHACLTLVTRVHLDPVFALHDADARFIGIVLFEIQIGTNTLAYMTCNALFGVGLQVFFHNLLLGGIIFWGLYIISSQNRQFFSATRGLKTFTLVWKLFHPVSLG